MTRLRLAALALGFVVAAVPIAALAQDAAKPSMTGKIITKKKLAECKRQAKDQKLTYGKRRKFVRACVNG